MGYFATQAARFLSFLKTSHWLSAGCGAVRTLRLNWERAWCAAVVGWVALSSGVACGEDWPKWRGVAGDGVWRETGIVERLPEAGPPVKWRLPIGPGYTGPSVADGKVFVMDRTPGPERTADEIAALRKQGILAGGERVLCLDQATGKILWQHEYPCDYVKISYPSGPRCTPVVEGEFVYTLGTMGDLKCLRVADGSVVWELRFSDRYQRQDVPARPPVWGYASHPIIDGPRLIVPVGGAGAAVVAFDKTTGQELWKNLDSSDIAYAPLIIYEGPAQERQLLFWHADGIDSLNPENGQHYWRHKFPEEQTQPGATTSIMTPQLIGDRFYVSEVFSGSLVLQIRSQPPAVQELHRSTADDPRHERSLNTLMTTPAVRDGLVYGVSGSGVFRCCRLETGEMVWENPKFMGPKPADFATIFMVQNGDRYFSLDDQGRLSIVRLSEKGYEEVSSCQLIAATEKARGRTVVWSHPAFANRSIVARNNEEIVCFDLSSDAKSADAKSN